MTRTMRQNLPEDVWDALDVKAAEAGVPVGVYTRDVLIASLCGVIVPLTTPVLSALTADARKNNSTPAGRAAFLLTRKYTP